MDSDAIKHYRITMLTNKNKELNKEKSSFSILNAGALYSIISIFYF